MCQHHDNPIDSRYRATRDQAERPTWAATHPIAAAYAATGGLGNLSMAQARKVEAEDLMARYPGLAARRPDLLAAFCAFDAKRDVDGPDSTISPALRTADGLMAALDGSW